MQKHQSIRQTRQTVVVVVVLANEGRQATTRVMMMRFDDSSSFTSSFRKPVNNYWTFSLLLLFVLFLVDGFHGRDFQRYHRRDNFGRGRERTSGEAVVDAEQRNGVGEDEENASSMLGVNSFGERTSGEAVVDAEQRNGVGEDEEENASSMLTLNSFDIAKIERSELTPNSENLKFFIVEGLIEREKLREILNDFPPALDSTTLANKKNVEKRDVLKTGQVKGTYAELLKDVESDAFRDAVGEKLGIKLKGWHNRVTLRGACEPNSCGGMNSIHVDHQAKAVSVLIYLNEETLDDSDYHGGDLLFLKNKKSLDDSNIIARVPSFGGTMVAFRNYRNVRGQKEAIHGLRPFKGKRRAVQVNWCKSKTCQ